MLAVVCKIDSLFLIEGRVLASLVKEFFDNVHDENIIGICNGNDCNKLLLEGEIRDGLFS